jgi:hypothetical protein
MKREASIISSAGQSSPSVNTRLPKRGGAGNGYIKTYLDAAAATESQLKSALTEWFTILSGVKACSAVSFSNHPAGMNIVLSIYNNAGMSIASIA